MSKVQAIYRIIRETSKLSKEDARYAAIEFVKYLSK